MLDRPLTNEEMMELALMFVNKKIAKQYKSVRLFVKSSLRHTHLQPHYGKAFTARFGL